MGEQIIHEHGSKKRHDFNKLFMKSYLLNLVNVQIYLKKCRAIRYKKMSTLMNSNNRRSIICETFIS